LATSAVAYWRQVDYHSHVFNGHLDLTHHGQKIGRVNRAVLWHLQLCLRLLDLLGYRVAAARVASAIDALSSEALSDGEISEMDLDREERIRLVLALFDKHGKNEKNMTDSPEED
jgi:hypothetical protein